MIKNGRLFILISCMGFLGCNTSRELGKVSLLSEKPVDFNKSYELKAMSRSAVAPTLQEAVARVIGQVKDGLYLENVTVHSLKRDKIKVTADVWGAASKPSLSSGKTEVNEVPGLNRIQPVQVGDNVSFTNAAGKIVNGKVVAVSGPFATVQFRNFRNVLVLRRIPVNQLTK